jgi:gluconate 2-dehydrogenase gamma chain
VDDPYAIGRRDFLKVGVTAAAVTAAGCGAPSGRWRVLSDEEAKTLAALCDRIVPPDQDPGAAQAGAVEFIDRQLATRQKERREIYRRGLAALDATARRGQGRAFADLGPDAQVALLQRVEKRQVDPADWAGVEPAAFLGVVVDHTMMGFYGDPRHGGNHGRVSWRMLGLPDPPVRGRLHETPPAPRAGAAKE